MKNTNYSRLSSVARRSLLSEKKLIERRDTFALAHKRSHSLIKRIGHTFLEGNIYQKASAEADPVKGAKVVGSLILSVEKIPAHAQSDKTGTTIAKGEPVIGLHLSGMERNTQREDILGDMQKVAEAIQDIPEAERPNTIASLTYKELGGVASRMGFEALPAIDLSADDTQDLKLNHDIFQLYNNRHNNHRERPLEPIVVTMPTQDFIARYAPSDPHVHHSLPRAA